MFGDGKAGGTMDWQTSKHLRKIAVCLVLTLSIAGCRSANGIDERPLLPLLGPVAINDSPPVAKLGTPIGVEPDPDVVLTGNAQEVKNAPRSSPIDSCFARAQTIDLATALHLANIENPVIGIADEVVRSNLAERMIARSLLFPTLNLGTTLSLHQGSLLSGTGVVQDVNRESLYFGAGADVRGAGTVAIPGVQVVSHLGDAFFAPRVAQQKVQSSRFDAAATRNTVLLEVANTYLALVGSEARILAYKQSETEYADVATLTENFANKGQGREGDAQRARSELMLLESAAQKVEEDVVLWTTELSRLLSTDATVRLRPEVGTPPLLFLVDTQTPIETLIEIAIAQRPEVAARNIDVMLNETRLRQERVRPFVPTIVAGFSAGDFGGGSNQVPYRFSHFNSRTDIDVLAVWTVQNMGFGNRAIQNQVKSQIGQAEASRRRMIDQVRGEVAEALAETKTARIKMEIARRRVETSQQAYRQDLERAQNLKGNLIEVLNSLNLLAAARQDLVGAMVGYSQSQFRLYVALGSMPVAPQSGDAGKK